MAITDVFFMRYADVLWDGPISLAEQRFFHQADKLMGERLWYGAAETESQVSEPIIRYLSVIHDRLAMELGTEYLASPWWYYHGNAQKHDARSIVRLFLTAAYEPSLGDPDDVMKQRLSFIELALRVRGQQVQKLIQDHPSKLEDAKRSDAKAALLPTGSRSYAVKSCEATYLQFTTGYTAVVDEINQRMRIAGIRFVYSNGLLHRSADKVSEDIIEQPFWSVVAHIKWVNVDFHMKEAVDKRDRGERDAAFAACQALESTIKIVCSDKGWVPEKKPNGAPGYLDLLGSKANGTWLADWERDGMKMLFDKVRNPLGHGPGADPVPVLSTETTDIVIDSAMAWIKLLIRRP